MPLPVRARYLMPLLLAVMALWPLQASAQVRRCTGPDGNPVYTDRPCEYIGATARLPRTDIATSGASRGYRGGCARSVRDLVYELTAAFDNHDANRLAGVAHWVGMSTHGAYSQMARLDALAQRTLIDIVPVYPAVHVVVEDAPSANGSATTLPFRLEGHGQDGPDAEAPPMQEAVVQAYPPTAIPNRPPVALRIEQTLANGSTPSRTVFGLQRHLGCWWIRL
ncbi:hypothetical protein IP90_00545 [Luteimonas cucumeris]|uniref:DUF4124 domain-containing protein n=1 Tax=Luteimonas cucumeris TaxID=985012 RepID=A0A562LF83_9GAMM|nr:hypothetical protein [Luteimonas cucumeris]TWI06279.1 hypothetical protein IP90_00545 [Luteimonas cucumeris]